MKDELQINLGKTYDKLRIFPKIFCKSGPRATFGIRVWTHSVFHARFSLFGIYCHSCREKNRKFEVWGLVYLPPDTSGPSYS